MNSKETTFIDALNTLIEASNTKSTGDITTGYSYGCTGIKYHDYYSERKQRVKKPIVIKNVIFNDPATIVFWSDRTKTIVKCGEHDTYDPEKGLAMAIAKKSFDNRGNYYNQFKKWLPVDKE